MLGLEEKKLTCWVGVDTLDRGGRLSSIRCWCCRRCWGWLSCIIAVDDAGGWMDVIHGTEEKIVSSICTTGRVLTCHGHHRQRQRQRQHHKRKVKQDAFCGSRDFREFSKCFDYKSKHFENSKSRPALIMSTTSNDPHTTLTSSTPPTRYIPLRTPN